MNTTNTKIVSVNYIRHQIIKDLIHNEKYNTTVHDENADLILYDKKSIEDIKLLPKQIISKIPFSYTMCYKYETFKTLESYVSSKNIYPKTYFIPDDINMFVNNDKYMIYKVSCGSFGKAVFIFKTYDELLLLYNKYNKYTAVVQEYIKPHLINGYKYDLRLYVYVENIKPYRVFLYNDGLIRLCTQRYEEPNENNYKNNFMHLTNTSVNKNNSVNKNILRILSENKEYFTNFYSLWSQIQHLTKLVFESLYDQILKNINIYNERINTENYNAYFQIFGIDILLNENEEPLLLEINDRPSLMYYFTYDYDFKYMLLQSVYDYVIKNEPLHNFTRVI